MATEVSIKLQVHIAWWFWPWVYTLAFFCRLMDGEPDPAALERMLKRAVSFRVAAHELA